MGHTNRSFYPHCGWQQCQRWQIDQEAADLEGQCGEEPQRFVQGFEPPQVVGQEWRLGLETKNMLSLQEAVKGSFTWPKKGKPAKAYEHFLHKAKEA